MCGGNYDNLHPAKGRLQDGFHVVPISCRTFDIHKDEPPNSPTFELRTKVKKKQKENRHTKHGEENINNERVHPKQNIRQKLDLLKIVTST